MNAQAKPDHGGGVDAAVAEWGGSRADWLDLSTGINPAPYPLPGFSPDCWTALPDQRAQDALIAAARRFWAVPEPAEVVAAPGASALIARMPALCPAPACIPGPTYNEHARAFLAAGQPVLAEGPAPVQVVVHPNNPDGRVWPATVAGGRLTVIDESFCDVMPEASQIARAATPGVIVLKSFGKFWGLAGLRLGFAIGLPETLRGPTGHLTDLLGPWPVSGPALHAGTVALQDDAWALATRIRLARDAARLDALVPASLVGGTSLFRLYDTPDAARWQATLARHHIWSRVFPYAPRWLRLGLPPAHGWNRLARALGECQ
ncbi:threonine-phosphate decarboxylase [Gemmobacter denitrificans]|uniref:Aminotransferase n=1 Tax=Gemmobacter denitrificans TaxID=3123040 RepID=A0ABU8BRJ7_9RHOB